MFLPINGRIVIIDNEINEVEPLFKVFSKKRIPFSFIKGDDSEYLPDEEDETNDIRIVFLDLNLLGNKTPSEKEVKSSIYPILKRVISTNNFPYSIILWSKQESDYAKTITELFDNELSDRKPIAIEPFIKSDFFNLDGTAKEQNDKDILKEVKNILLKHQAYSSLIYWENKVHKSADKVLQTIFEQYNDDTWVDKTNFIITKLGQAFLGFKNYNDSDYVERTKGSLQAFNSVFYDTLEYDLNTISHIEDQATLSYDETKLSKEFILHSLNYKLIAAETDLQKDYTGVVVEDTNPKSDKLFKIILSECIDRFSLKDNIVGFDDFDSKQQKRKLDKANGEMRSEIYKCWKKVYLVVTPLCDKVQNKHRKIRAVKGIIIEEEFSKNLDKKTEALFVSPPFILKGEEKSFVLVVNFRYFFTYPTEPKFLDKLKHINPIFRLRTTIISEIQSKLARHINRQGILYVE